MLTSTMILSFENLLQAFSTNSTRPLLIGIPSYNQLLRQQRLVWSMSPQEYALSKSLICALHFDTLEYLLMGLQWCLVTTSR